MALRLFVLRHGETAWSRERRFSGARDVSLTADGRRQCEAAAAALASVPLAAVYASQLERARVTAEIVAKPHRLEVIVDPAFAEMGFGEWEGATRDEVAARHPEAWDAWRVTPDRVVIPGGERLTAVAERVARGLEALRAEHDGGEPVVLVTHAIVVRLLVLGALGLGPDRLWSVDASPAGISELEYRDDWVTVHRVNNQAHLEQELGR
jgi:broad specificity phosphatase PhoE